MASTSLGFSDFSSVNNNEKFTPKKEKIKQSKRNHQVK